MKHCSKCNTTKPLDEFANNKAKKDGKQTICKKCRKEWWTNHYSKNKQYYIDKAAVKTKELIGLTERHKSFCGCEKCGEKRHWVLDYHHLENKDENIANLVSLGSVKKLKREIRKCIVLCSNCHRDLHYKEKMRL